MRQHLRAMLLRQAEALAPIPLPGVHVERSTHIGRCLHQRIRIALAHQVRLVALLHMTQHVRQFRLRQHARLVPQLAGEVAAEGLARCVGLLVELRRGIEPAHVLEPLCHITDDIDVPVLRVTHGEPDGVLPDFLQALRFGGVLFDGEVGVDGARIIPCLLVYLRCLQDLLRGLLHAFSRPAIIRVEDVAKHVRAMLFADPRGLIDHALLGVRLHGQLGLARLDEQTLGRWQVVLVDHILRLVHHDFFDAVAMVVLGHAHGRHPVALVDIHVDRLLRLIGRDKLILRQLVLLVVLQGQGLLKVNVRQFVRGVGSKLKCMREVAVLHSVIDGEVDEAVLREQLGTGFCTMLLPTRLRLREDDLFECLLPAMQLRNTLRVFPTLHIAVHGHGAGPHLCLNIVVLRLGQVPLQLELLRNVLVCVIEELLPVPRNQA
mmetsp:Transcript_43825/g.127598  ORF Transcript_43825/g.127598 Transcript_43825/m.127598 type:complete len:433 (+) Transcript_43825:1042-2340(+)